MNTRTRRVWWLVAVGVFAVVVLGGILVAGYRLSEAARDTATEMVEARFDRQVEIEALSLTFLPRPRATARGLVVHQKEAHAGLPPFITIDSLAVDLSLWRLLLVRPLRIDAVALEGLEIHIPPDGGEDEDDGEDDPGVAADDGDSTDEFVITRLSAPQTLLYIHSDEPGNEPLLWDIRELDMESAGTTEPMAFDAVIENAKPPGLVRSTGRFGPWQEDDLARTPVSGEYTFEDADLSVFDGIRGVLSSEGAYEGVLGRLDVRGTTDTPDFALDVGGNPVPLRTEFATIVDGTNGNTVLDPVRAWIGETPLVARGGVVHRDGPDGKTIELDVEIDGGRIDDLLLLSMQQETPFMTGGFRMKIRFLLPQGEGDVIDKLRLDGTFAIAQSRFAEANFQEKVDELSSRSRGQPENPRRVASNFQGAFTLDSAIVDLSSLSFEVPGARVELAGTYDLDGKRIAMHGDLHMDATLSETTTGFKSFLLMLVEPFFGGDNGEGSTVPIKITGTPSEPDFGLDLGGGQD